MPADVSGTWYNQHGSRMNLSVDANGRVRGSFHSGIGFPDPEEEFELAGFAADDLIGFVVSFAKYDSITSWTGHFGVEDGKQTLYVLWHMTVGLLPGETRELWQAIWSGADTFLREPAARMEPHRRAASHPTSRGERLRARVA